MDGGPTITTFSYKNFDLNVYIIARWGQMIDYELVGSYDPSGKRETSLHI